MHSCDNTATLGIGNPRLTGCFVDWLSLTFPPNVQIDTLRQFIHGLVLPGEFEAFGGRDGYKSSYRTFDRSIELLMNGGHEDMGPHLIMKGRACNKYSDDLFVLIRKAVELGAKVARLDVSIDEYAGLLDLDEMGAALRGGCCVSKYRKEPRMEQFYHPSTGKVVGKIVRFGSRTSKVSIRFYDKGMQKGEDFHWLRTEIELKKSAAHQVANDWIHGTPLNDLFFGILSSYLSFRDPVDDSNRSRWPVAPWWQLF